LADSGTDAAGISAGVSAGATVGDTRVAGATQATKSSNPREMARRRSRIFIRVPYFRDLLGLEIVGN
jgi:hypothetical protein